MADWPYVPAAYHQTIPFDGPTMLVHTTVDKREFRRVLSNDKRRIWLERYEWTAAEMKGAMDFWDIRGLHTTFTRISYDPQATNPLTDEATVRFVRPIVPVITSCDGAEFFYSADVEMIEELT